MTIEFYKVTEAMNTPAIAWDTEGKPTEFGEPFPVLLWKFKDQDGNLWNTETDINGTEMEAASIILGSIQ